MKTSCRASVVVACVVAICAPLCLPACAQYTVTSTVGGSPGDWTYTWVVHNLDQGSGAPVGLDGFFVLVPHYTHVVSYSVPPTYSPGPPGDFWGYGEFNTAYVTWHPFIIVPDPPPGYKWLAWWGAGWTSPYPVGSCATFSIATQDTTIPGTVTNAAVTWWGPARDTYSTYFGATIGPSVVPEPSSVALLGLGLAGVVASARRRKKVLPQATSVAPY